MIWISNYIHIMGFSYLSMRNFNGGLAIPPLTLDNGWVITSLKTADVITRSHSNLISLK